MTIDGGLIYAFVRLGLSIWALIMAIVLLVQSVPRIRQTAPTWERRLRMASIVFVNVAVIGWLLVASIYTFGQPLPSDAVIILLSVAPRATAAIITTILVFTRPDPSDEDPPSDEELADFRAWQRSGWGRWWGARKGPPGGQ